jgi:hypothetical protein
VTRTTGALRRSGVFVTDDEVSVSRRIEGRPVVNSSRFDHRYADRFDELVEETDRGPRSHRRTASDDEVLPLVALARRLHGLAPAPAPDPAFQADLRALLLATGERDGIGMGAETTAWISTRALTSSTQANRQVAGRHTRRARLAILAGITAGAVALSGVSAASSNSLPGEPLYEVKRSTEQAQLAFAGSDLSRGQLYLKFAAGRLDEARRVPGDRLASVLADMDEETRQAVGLLTTAAVRTGDQSLLAALDAFAVDQQGRLAALRESLPAHVANQTAESLDLLTTVRVRVTRLTSALRERCQIGAFDTLGPDPRGC